MAGKSPFSKDLFQFLVELKFNNERPWFQANKARYESAARRPMAGLIQALAKPLARVNPAIVPGSVFRIYRDTRFAKDKTPYKTHLAAQFRHRAESQNVHAPGFYLHLEPGECHAAAGIWAPKSGPLRMIRRYIVQHPGAWAPFSRQRLWGDSLKRPPKGFPKDHQYMEDIKRRHFISWVDFKDAEVLDGNFQGKVIAAFRKLNPMMLFLCKALRLK